MTPRRALLSLVCVLPLCALLVLAQNRVDAALAEDQEDTILYLPNEKLLNHFTAGMNSVIADLIWLECVNYVSIQSEGDGNFQWLKQMVNTAVRLDPYFADVYRFGGMFLAGLDADDEAGLDLLKRGIVINTDSWELPYEAALIYLLNRSKDPGSKEIATLYLSMSASKEYAPEVVRDIAARLQGEFNFVELEREMWTGMLNNPDKLIRDMAKQKLAELEIRLYIEDINAKIDQFIGLNGIPPGNLQEVATFNSPDALGGRFFVGPNNRMQNTTLLNAEKTRILKMLQDTIQKYYDENGQFPPQLETITQYNFLPAIPPHPYPGLQWSYNPQTGTVK